MKVKVILYDDDQGFRLNCFRVVIGEGASKVLEGLSRNEAEQEVCASVRRQRRGVDEKFPNANWVVVWPKGSCHSFPSCRLG